MKKALLVIDMQEVTVGAAHADFFKYDNELLNRVNSVIGSTDATVVVYIRNLMKNNFINNYFFYTRFDSIFCYHCFN